MEYEIGAVEIQINLTDAPEVTGLTSGLKTETVFPVSAEIIFYPEGTLARREAYVNAKFTGPKRKADGSLTAHYGQVKVSTDSSGPITMPPPEWVLGLIEEVRRPAAPEEPDPTPYVRRPGDRCIILGDGLVEHVDCDEHPKGTITDVRTGKVVSRPPA